MPVGFAGAFQLVQPCLTVTSAALHFHFAVNENSRKSKLTCAIRFCTFDNLTELLAAGILVALGFYV